MSTVSSYVRSYTPEWISQFGLYRYESAEPKLKPTNQPRQRITLYGVIAMLSVLMFFLYIFFDENEEIKSANALKQDFVNQTILESIEINRNIEQTEEKSEILEDYRNETDVHSRRIKRLDYKDSLKITPEKLIILPSRSLQPPKLGKMSRVRFPKKDIEVFESKLVSSDPNTNLRNHKLINHNMNPNGMIRRKPFIPQNRRQFLDMITSNPRPFGFQIIRPSGFKKPQITTTKTFPLDAQESQLNSIQEILNLEMANTDPSQKRRNGNMVEIAGTYRHPRKNDFTRLFIPTLATVTPTTQIQPQPYFTPSYPQNFVTDPFNNFRPSSPNDVNLLAMNQVRFTPVQQVRIFKTKGIRPTVIQGSASDMEAVYHKIIRANNQRLRQQQLKKLERDGSPRHKPFSLMLDVYPMPNDEDDTAPTTIPVPIRIKKPPLSAFTGHDNSYFSTMNFPQIIKPRHPSIPTFFNHMYKHYNPNPYKQLSPENQGNEAHQQQGPNKPSQLVVHLNLYPKNKKNKTSTELGKRSSKENHEVLIDHKTASSEIYNKKIKNYKRNNETMKPPMKVANSDESVDLSYPLSINLNLNGHPHNIIDHIDIPKSHYGNVTVSGVPTTIEPHNLSYEDDDSPLHISPSSVYTLINRKNKSKMKNAATTSTTTTSHPIFVDSEEYPADFHVSESDYVNFEHKDARKHL